MSRELDSHKINGCNESLTIEVTDEPGAGGACHSYHITGYDAHTNPSAVGSDGYKTRHSRTIILFQNGPIKEVGVNGLTQEALLAICIDRLQCFQKGPYECRENALALTNLEQAQMWLQKRTNDRLRRGVEGTHEK